MLFHLKILILKRKQHLTVYCKETGANIVSCSRDNVADTIESVINQCMNDGLTPYYINGDKYGKAKGSSCKSLYQSL